MKYTIGISLIAFLLVGYLAADVNMTINTAYTVDSLGACQGVSYQKGRIFLLWRS